MIHYFFIMCAPDVTPQLISFCALFELVKVFPTVFILIWNSFCNILFIYSVIIEEKWVFTANLLQLNFIISHYWRFVSSNTDAFGSPVQNITLHLCIVSIKICTKEKQMFALGPFLFLLFLCNMRYFLTLFWSYLVFCFNFVSEQRAILLITGLGTCTTPLHK